MKEPLYRWLCPMCGISDEAESAEMARLNIDVHMGIAHPTSREAVRVQLDPSHDVVTLDTLLYDGCDLDARKPAQRPAGGRSGQTRMAKAPTLDPSSEGNRRSATR